MLSGRACKITLGGSIVLADFSTERRERGLRCAFEITKTSTADPQTSVVRVWGLSRRTRDILTRAIAEAREKSYEEASALQTAKVRVEAGQPGRTGVLSDDWIIETPTHSRDGADWVTTLSCQDGRVKGEGFFVSETVSTEPSPAATARSIEKAAEILGEEGAQALDPQLAIEGFGRMSGSLTSFGAPNGTQVLQTLGITPIWQRGQLVWVRTDAPQGFALRLTEGRSLLTLSEPAAYGYREGTAILDPEIELGRQIWISRDRGSDLGPYRVDTVTYTGDTDSIDWYAKIKLRPTAGSAQAGVIIN